VSDSTRPGVTVPCQVREVAGPVVRSRPDRLVTEEPLELRVGWPGRRADRLSVTMRTPGADFDLAAGFVLSEGLIAPGETPRTITYCLDSTLTREQRYNVVTVELARPPMRPPIARFGAISSACGVCGAQALEDIQPPDRPPLTVTDRVDSALLSRLPDLLRGSQRIFAATGAAHAAGVFDYDGSIVVCREDVGRHNAVDKVLGSRVLGTVCYDERAVLCVSGRIGFDIVSKAVAGQIGLVIGVGAPSSLAVSLAERAGLTLCGFVRGDRYVIYSHPDRIALPAS
jgi:FdhD protein